MKTQTWKMTNDELVYALQQGQIDMATFLKSTWNRQNKPVEIFLESIIRKCIIDGRRNFENASVSDYEKSAFDFVKEEIVRELLKYVELKEIKEYLLPCPFCGGKGEAVRDAFWVVQCTDCFCESASCDTEEQAIQSWNKRT